MRIDSQLSAKFMAAALNFNSAIKTLFGPKYGLESEQAFSIQFSPSMNEPRKNWRSKPTCRQTFVPSSLSSRRRCRRMISTILDIPIASPL